MEEKPIEEKLEVMTLQKFVRSRPDTHVGRVAKIGSLRWLIAWKHELRALALDAPIATLGAEETRKLRSQQQLLFGDDDAGTALPTLKRKRSAKTPDETPVTLTPHDPHISTLVDAVAEEVSLPVLDGVLAAPPSGDSDAVAVLPDAAEALTSSSSTLTLKDAGVARVLVEVSPALEKIVDEILQNALDRQHKDAAMKRIDVRVDAVAGRVIVRNDGLGMPVPKPERTHERVPDAYWPTIVCTVDMAGGNFAPAAGGHYSGGRNGIGMKATNILSSFFRFEVGDAVNHLKFTQEWYDGMTRCSEPVVRAYKAARGYVEVTFDPDLAFFGEVPGAGFSTHVAALIRSRVWEIAAHSRAIVTLDGVKLPLRASIAGLASLFRAPALLAAHTGPKSMPLSAKHTLPDGRVVLEVTIMPARDGVPADIIGFVNGIRCNRGAHVEVLLKTVAAALLDAVRRKAKRPDMKFLSAAQVRNAMFAVLAVNIDGPAFDHQNKAELDSPETSWGWKWTPEPAFCARAVTLLADDIAATLVQRSEQKALSAANALTDGSSSRRIVNIAKYEPADNAGCADTQAVLVLTEGDSAMSLAMAGRAVRGSKDMGVFCLKGKPPNPRGKSIMKITDNKVLANVSKILGLEYGRVFTSETDIRRRLNYR